MIWRAKLHVLAYTGSLWECEDGVKLSADCTAECEAISDSWPWGGYYMSHATALMHARPCICPTFAFPCQ